MNPMSCLFASQYVAENYVRCLMPVLCVCVSDTKCRLVGR